MSYITTTGSATVTAAPDKITLSLTLKSTDKDYKSAMSDASKKLEGLRNALSAVGFSRDDLKTDNFSVNSEYENEQNDKGRWVQIFKGYSVVNSMSLSFGFDTECLSASLAAASESGSDPEIGVSFGVYDETGFRDRALTDAVNDARHKAEIICMSLGDKHIKDIVSVENGDTGHNFIARPEFMLAKAPGSNAAVPDITPSDIKINDSVTVKWEIE